MQARILQMSLQAFHGDTQAQRELFAAAHGAAAREQAFGDDVVRGIPGAEVVSGVKRDDLDGFVASIEKKLSRPEFDRLDQVTDVIRGRIDVPSAHDVRSVVQEMVRRCPGATLMEPLPNYPRYHVIVREPETGLQHEWQIGTKATSDFLEVPRVTLPPALGQGNFHDMWFTYLMHVPAAAPLQPEYDALLKMSGEGQIPPAPACQRLAQQMAHILTDLHRTQPVLLETLKH